MNRKNMVFFSCFTLFLASVPAPAADCVLQVREPRSGQEVASGVSVEGIASLPPGQHLWVFARRVNFKPLWWPQGEALVDPNSGKWKVFATIGAPQDVGWDFDVAVAVFATEEHLQLQNGLTKAMETGNFRPIRMPEAVCPPIMLGVKKTSHD